MGGGSSPKSLWLGVSKVKNLLVSDRIPWTCVLVQRGPWMQSVWLPRSPGLSVEAPRHSAIRKSGGGEERVEAGGALRGQRGL